MHEVISPVPGLWQVLEDTRYGFNDEPEKLNFQSSSWKTLLCVLSLVPRGVCLVGTGQAILVS